MRRLRSLKALVHDAVDGVTDLVREGQEAAGRTVLRVTDAFPPIAGTARLVEGVTAWSNATTLASVIAVNRVVEALTDAALDATGETPAIDEPPVPMRADIVGTPAWIADAALGAVNGSIGDHLSARGNALDLGLSLRHGDRMLRAGDRVDTPSGRIVVLVHGLATTEWSWCFEAGARLGDPAANFGTKLARDHGVVPLFARYNTGRRIGINGAALAEALDRVVSDWPVPVTRVVLIGHSMGGLVARSALGVARAAGYRWGAVTDLVVSLASPHQGAPLAQAADAAAALLGGVDLPATRIISRVIDARSAGVKDLATGHLGGSEADAPLLDDVRYVFLSATITADATHPLGVMIGDLMVRAPSAAGPHVETGRFAVETENFGGVKHFELQTHPAVYAQVSGAIAR